MRCVYTASASYYLALEVKLKFGAGQISALDNIVTYPKMYLTDSMSWELLLLSYVHSCTSTLTDREYARKIGHILPYIHSYISIVANITKKTYVALYVIS